MRRLPSSPTINCAVGAVSPIPADAVISISNRHAMGRAGAVFVTLASSKDRSISPLTWTRAGCSVARNKGPLSAALHERELDQRFQGGVAMAEGSAAAADWGAAAIKAPAPPACL